MRFLSLLDFDNVVGQRFRKTVFPGKLHFQRSGLPGNWAFLKISCRAIGLFGMQSAGVKVFLKKAVTESDFSGEPFAAKPDFFGEQAAGEPGFSRKQDFAGAPAFSGSRKISMLFQEELLYEKNLYHPQRPQKEKHLGHRGKNQTVPFAAG